MGGAITILKITDSAWWRWHALDENQYTCLIIALPKLVFSASWCSIELGSHLRCGERWLPPRCHLAIAPTFVAWAYLEIVSKHQYFTRKELDPTWRKYTYTMSASSLTVRNCATSLSVNFICIRNFTYHRYIFIHTSTISARAPRI